MFNDNLYLLFTIASIGNSPWHHRQKR